MMRLVSLGHFNHTRSIAVDELDTSRRLWVGFVRTRRRDEEIVLVSVGPAEVLSVVSARSSVPPDVSELLMTRFIISSPLLGIAMATQETNA